MNQEYLYLYKVIDFRVIDGDTVDLTVDLGFHIYHKIRVRLEGIDTPEIYGRYAKSEKELGYRFKECLQHFLASGKDLYVETKKDKTGKYGRYIADIYVNGKSATEALLEFAKEIGIDITYGGN